jgi:hypothetical protein
VLTGVLWFLGLLPFFAAFDWLACTRIAAYFDDFEYSYRPSRVRYLLLALAAAGCAYMKVTYDPLRQPIAGLLIETVVFLVWAGIANREVQQALIPSDLAPKRYAGQDDY